MAQRTARIVRDSAVLHGEPRIEGRRISVRQLAQWVEESGVSARAVADRHDLDVADVYAALAYYHSHPDEMATAARRRREYEQRARDAGAVSLTELREGDDA